MNQHAGRWIVAAIAVLGLAPVSVLFGLTLLPARATVLGAGTLIPWLLTWGFIWMTALIAIALAAFLFGIGVRSSRSPNAAR